MLVVDLLNGYLLNTLYKNVTINLFNKPTTTTKQLFTLLIKEIMYIYRNGIRNNEHNTMDMKES